MLFALLLACSGSVQTKPDPETDLGDADHDGVTILEGDCDDHDPSIYPGANEIFYDGIDQNCFASDDDDKDGDGFSFADDCDDTDSQVNPMSVEVCNGEDDDCDGDVDGGLGVSGYIDTDGDGYGEGDTQVVVCDGSTNVVEKGGDCDENNPDVHPDQPELCDGLDQDCDTIIDENAGQVWYPDVDGDGFGDGANGEIACGPVGIEDGSDCNDLDSSSFPGAVEREDGADNDCDGRIDENAVKTGEVVFTELSVTPSLGADAQWIEIRNTSGRTLHLDGWTFEGNGRSVLLPSLQLVSDGMAVLCRSYTYAQISTTASQLNCDFAWTDDALSPDANGLNFDNQLVLGAVDSVALSVEGLEVDRVSWDGSWPFSSGYTLSTNTTAIVNNSVSSWCLSSYPDVWYDDGQGILEYGSPAVLKSCAP